MRTVARLLIKDFGKSFYRINAGFLIASFTILVIYGVFIKTAGHIPPGQSLTINLILLIKFIQTPIVTLLVSLLWFAYAVKSWRYIWKTSVEDDRLFWYYSLTAMHVKKQLVSWMLFQLYIFLPLIVYWILATIFGLFTQHYRIPLITGAYLIILVFISACLYLYRFNYHPLGKANDPHYWLTNWRKPMFSLLLFDILHHKKIAYLITKGFSALLIIGFYQLFHDVDQPIRTATIIVLCITLIHAVMVYQGFIFEERHLYFTRQFPYKRSVIFFTGIVRYGVLILPELSWCLMAFPILDAIQLMGMALMGVLFIRSSLDSLGFNIRSFLKLTFGWFFTMFILLLYDWGWYLIGVNLIVSFYLFYKNYYMQETSFIK